MVVDQTSSRPRNSDRDPLYGARLILGKCFGAFSQSIHWAGHLWLSYKIHFLLHVTIWLSNGSLFHRIREDDISKWFIFFSVICQGTYSLSFFTFSVCSRCQLTIEWPAVSSWTASVVVGGPASMVFSVGHCPLPVVGTCTRHLQGSCLLCKASWTTAAVRSLAVPGPKALYCWCRELSLVLYDQLWTQIKKLLEFAFYLI